MQCDFCSGATPTWRFEAATFAVDFGPVLAASDPGWTACDACCRLVLAGDREGLADRAVREGPPLPIPRDEMREALRTIHDLFFTHQLASNPTRIDGANRNDSNGPH